MTESQSLSDIRIEQISIVIRDRDAMIGFYTKHLGMDHLRSAGKTHLLGFGAQEPLLELVEENTAMARPPGAPGLFHMAFLYPNRQQLATALRRLISTRWALQGAADHGVSEAIYLEDPEGNGIEIYADRPKDSWSMKNGEIRMVTEPLDLDELLAEKEKHGSGVQGVRIGHVHLQVSSLSAAETFWCAGIGLEATQRSFPGALFVSAGGYHHHLGLNTWRSSGGTLPEGVWTGLRSLIILVPDDREFSVLAGRLEGADTSDQGMITTRFETTTVHIHATPQ